MRRNSSKKSKAAGAKVDTLVGHETELLGDIRFSGGLHVDGVVKGNVYAEEDSQSVAIISESGRIEGELRVPNLLINGFVAGDVYAGERLDLARNARVNGDVYYRTMEMASGAEINGKLVRTDEVEQRFLEHEGQKTAPSAGPDASNGAPEGSARASDGATEPGQS